MQRRQSLEQVSFGNADKGIDGFHFDPENCIFRIFQFKNSKDQQQLLQSIKKMAEVGIPALLHKSPIPDHQPVVDAARDTLHKVCQQVARVQVDFVFRFDVETARTSAIFPALEEGIEKFSWRFSELTGRENLVPEVRVLHFDGLRPDKPSEKYPFHLEGNAEITCSDGVQMRVGFAPLIELVIMYNQLGKPRFFERNIRFGLGNEGYANRALARTLRTLLTKDNEDVKTFALNHNGPTLSAQALNLESEPPTIMAPRLLNGAQTI